MGLIEHIDSIGDEIAQVRAWQGRRDRVQARVDSFTDDDAIRLSQFTRYYPHTPFGILEPLAREAFPLDHPVVQLITQTNYQRNAYEGGTGNRGSIMTGRGLANMSNWSTKAEADPGPYVPNVTKTAEFSTASLPRRLYLLEQARIRDRKPISYEQTLQRQGFLDSAGNLVRPSERKFIEYTDKGAVWAYDSPEAEQKDRQFFELMRSIAQDQGTSEPIPFITAAGEQSLYHPRTGNVEAIPTPHERKSGIRISLPGPVDEIWDRGRSTVNDWLTNRRIPTLPAGRRVQVGGYSGRTPAEVGRASFMVGNAPIQEAQGIVRNVYGELHGEDVNWGESQSDLGVMLGTGADAGNGYFVDPESEVAEERRRREAERGLIGNHSVTAGRWLADSVGLQVDTKPFNLVSGSLDFAAQVLDPYALTALKVSRISAARRMFEPEEVTGLFSGVRQQFHGPTWNTFRDTPDGTKIREAIAAASGDKSSSYQIWSAFERKIDPETAVRLYEADDVGKVDDVFNDIVGSQIRSPHQLDMLPWKLGDGEGLLNFNPHFARTELERLQPTMLPAYDIDPSNKKDAAIQMERWLTAGKAGNQTIEETFDMIARADTKAGIEQAVEHAMSAEQGILAQHGVASPQKRRQLTQLWRQTNERAFDALMDEIGADVPNRDIFLANGIAVQDLDPQLPLEYLSKKIPLPDINRIKRVLADPKYRWLLTSMDSSDIGKPRFPEAAMHVITEEFWKPAMLLGRFPAWITRVVGEEQIRIAQAGMSGIFNHPISAFAIAIGRKIKTTPSGNAFDELQEFEGALIKTHGGNLRKPGSVRMAPTHYDKFNPDHADDYLNAFADQVAQLHYNPVSRELVDKGVDDTVEWLKGPGRNSLRILREAEPGKFTTDSQIRDYLTRTLGERINIVTGNNPELLDAIRSGKLQGVNMFKKGGPKLNREYVNMMNDYLDDGPRLVKGFRPIDDIQRRKWNNFLNWAFSNTMTRATNFASRSPFFKQSLWKNTADILPYASDDVKSAILSKLDEASLSGTLRRQVEKAATKKGTTQINSVEELEHLAAGYAADATKATLYDLAERGQLAESLRLVAPFANAYQEIWTTWPKLLVGRQYGWVGKFASVARASRRVQQVIDGGRNNGWFMKNQFGEEVFVFPGSQAFTKAVTGVPVPLTGRLKGLNMTFDVFPGVGPVAAVPVAWMLHGKPGTWKDIYDQLLPYGAPGERDPDDISNLLSYAPSWIQKLAIAGSAGPPPGIKSIPGIEHIWPSREEVLWDNNAYMNTVKDVMKYNLSTGNFDPSTREGMQELLEKSKDQAKDLYYIRAAMQFFAPTAPAFNFLVQDKSGHLLAQWTVTEEYYNLLDKGMDMDEASAEIMDKYGPDILSLTVPKTRAATYNVPRTREAGEWVYANRDIRDKYPAVYGFFAPQGGELDYSVLVNQFSSGEVDVLTPNQWLNLRNEMMQTLEYNYYKDQVGNSPNDQESAWLRQIRSELAEAYPSSTAGILEKPEYEDVIPELYDAIEDPKLRNTDMGQALREYFYYRDQAQDYAVNVAGYAGFAKPNALYPTREWLAGIAQDIMKDYPDFELVWSTTLSREFEKELR